MRKNTKKLKVAWLYPLPKKKLLAAHLRGEEPDKLSGIEYIKNFSITPVLIDPYEFPLNPFRDRHSLYSGIDLLRTLKLLLSLNKYDAVLSVGESSVLLLLSILIWDPAVDFNWKARKIILDIVLPKADKVLLVGTNQQRLLKQRYGTTCKSDVIHHWVDSDFYRPLHQSTGDYVFSIGNDVSRDFQTLVKAMNGLDVKLVIKTDKHRLPENILLPNVTHLKERVPYTRLRKLYADSMFVVVSLHNCPHAGGVNSVLESMAMGKAAIVSDSEGIRDFVVDGETAIVVRPDDTDALRNAITYLANNPEDVKRIGINARRVVEKRFSIMKFSERLAKAVWDTYLKYGFSHK